MFDKVFLLVYNVVVGQKEVKKCCLKRKKNLSSQLLKLSTSFQKTVRKCLSWQLWRTCSAVIVGIVARNRPDSTRHPLGDENVTEAERLFFDPNYWEEKE